MSLGALILATRFLTILPVPGRTADGPGALGRAAWCFPVVGAALGAALVGIDRLLGLACPPVLASVLLVALWKILTGGIHLDGLADCLDGLAGGDAGRRLAIMRDSRVGVFGALGLIACILAAVAAVTELPARSRWRLLLLAPVLGRVAPLLVGPWFRAATPGHGLGASFLGALSRRAGPVHLLAALTLAVVLFGAPGIAVVAGPIALVFVWTAFVARRLGGITGDVLGAGVEVGELAVLLTGSVLAHVGAI